MSRLIVKNIPNNISEFDIKKHFESVGDITDVKISFKGDKNRRFCFVGYKTEQAAQKAKSHFDGTFLGMSKVHVDFARTLDDPNLPRPWSKHTQGSTAYDQKNKTNKSWELIQSKKVKTNENDDDNQEPDKKVDSILNKQKEAKFAEFKKLMKRQSGNTMSWNDNIEQNQDTPKERQKQLKELKKQKALEAKVTNETIDKIFDQTKQVVEKVKEESKTQQSVDSKRLYVTNIPYNSTEQEIRTIFEKYGTVILLKLPKGRGGILTGYCFVTYSLSDEAMRAYVELDNKIVMGRILHVKPSYENDKAEPVILLQEQTVQNEKSSYKKEKKANMIKKLEDSTNWNSLFLNPNSILEYVSRKYKIKKREILSQEGDEIAVRVAMAETQVVNETKQWLTDIGMKLDFLDVGKEICERSKLTILVKNIQYKVDETQLHEVFARFGKVRKIYLSPNRALGIVQFENEQFAENAFKNLSYFKCQGSYFYLEWAPKSMLNETPTKKENVVTSNEADQQQLVRIVYVKNLNFTTTEKQLKKVFNEYQVVSVKIIRKDELSLGYGFVEFGTPEDAAKALRQKQNFLLDEHNLQLSQSKPKPQIEMSKRKQQEDLTPTTKLILRNLPFETNINEVRSLVKQYGELKKVRLPKKMNGQHRGFCFVEFVSIEEAKSAFMALQNTHFYGRKLVIEYSKME